MPHVSQASARHRAYISRSNYRHSHDVVSATEALTVEYTKPRQADSLDPPRIASHLCDNLTGVLPWKPRGSLPRASEGILLRPARLFPKTELDQVVGCLRYKGKAKTLKEMESAFRIGVMRRHESGRY